MAQRLATEYVKTCLVLSEEDLSTFLQLFQHDKLTFQVKVLENGDREVEFPNAAEADPIVLTFEHKQGNYVLGGSCRFTDLKLANAMRKGVSQFKGNAVVRRIYPSYTLEYHYHSGSVIHISELTRQGRRIVYERKDTAWQLLETYRKLAVEKQIEDVKLCIDHLLDRRIRSMEPDQLQIIDEDLTRLTHRLFVLEA